MKSKGAAKRNLNLKLTPLCSLLRLFARADEPGTKVQSASLKPHLLQHPCPAMRALRLSPTSRHPAAAERVACMPVICTPLATCYLAGPHACSLRGLLLLILTANGKPAGWSYYCAYRSLWKVGVWRWGARVWAHKRGQVEATTCCSYLLYRLCAATQESHQASERALAALNGGCSAATSLPKAV